MTRARDVANLIGSGNYSSTTFTATAGQTAFTISHTQGFIQVFMNGLLLDETVDYTSNGSAVTLTSGAAAGDEIEVVAYNTFSVGDALNQAAADTRYVNATGDTMSGDLVVSKTTTPTIQIKDGQASGTRVSGKLHIGEAATLGVTIENSTTSYNDNCAMVFKTSPAAGTLTERMRIDSSGRVTKPYQPFIICTGSSSSVASYSAGAVITHWNNQVTPVGITRSGGRFTVPVAGKYQFNSNLYSYVSSAGHYRTNLMLNGSQYALAQLEITTAGIVASPYDTTLNFSLILNLAANDYVELKVDGAQDYYAGSVHNNLSMFLLG